MTSFLKFLVVGTIGFVINTSVLIFGVRLGFKPSIAGPVGAELAIVSNFIFNNIWTFSDKTITSWSLIPWKFLQFNVLSLGSVVIQFIFLKIGELIFGLEEYKVPVLQSPKFMKLPFIGRILRCFRDKIINKIFFFQRLANKFSAYLIFYVVGVSVGLIWNFVMYSQVIWR